METVFFPETLASTDGIARRQNPEDQQQQQQHNDKNISIYEL
jgi:hypothetical protein